jgi:hypothetical protein
MFTLIKSVLKSVELFLKLKNKKFYYDLYLDHKAREEELVYQIEEFRESGDSNDADRADILRKHLKYQREQFEHLSAFYSKTEEE